MAAPCTLVLQRLYFRETVSYTYINRQVNTLTRPGLRNPYAHDSGIIRIMEKPIMGSAIARKPKHDSLIINGSQTKTYPCSTETAKTPRTCQKQVVQVHTQHCSVKSGCRGSLAWIWSMLISTLHESSLAPTTGANRYCTATIGEPLDGLRRLATI